MSGRGNLDIPWGNVCGIVYAPHPSRIHLEYVPHTLPHTLTHTLRQTNALQGVFLKGVAMSVSPCKNKPFQRLISIVYKITEIRFEEVKSEHQSHVKSLGA